MISIVIPVFNESENVRMPYEAISKLMADEGYEYELIFVDDGSGDDSYIHLKNLSEKDHRVKVLKLLSNAGAHMAIRAGLENASGEMAVFLACDLQEPPELIPQMVKKLEPDIDIVLAVRNSRNDSFLDKFLSRIFFGIMKFFISSKLPDSGSSMYLLGSKALKALRQYPERNMSLEGIFLLNNFRYKSVNYDRQIRGHGQSKWTLSAKIKIFIDFFVAYSHLPIRMVSLMGILFSLAGFVWTAYIIYRTLVYSDLAPGWPTLISVLLLGFGITNFSLGVVAEYLWRTLDESRRRPKYIVEEKINFVAEKL